MYSGGHRTYGAQGITRVRIRGADDTREHVSLSLYERARVYARSISPVCVCVCVGESDYTVV